MEGGATGDQAASMSTPGAMRSGCFQNIFVRKVIVSFLKFTFSSLEDIRVGSSRRK